MRKTMSAVSALVLVVAGTGVLAGCGGRARGHVESQGTVGGAPFSAADAAFLTGKPGVTSGPFVWLSSSVCQGADQKFALFFYFDSQLSVPSSGIYTIGTSAGATVVRVSYSICDASGLNCKGGDDDYSGSTGTVTVKSSSAATLDAAFDVKIVAKHSDGSTTSDHVSGTFDAVRC